MAGARFRNVIFVVEAPFSPRDAMRFGVRMWQDAGFDVQVWEVQDIFQRRNPSEVVLRSEECPLERFRTRKQLRIACKTLTRTTLVILLSGVYGQQTFSRRTLLQSLSLSHAKLATVAVNSRPALQDSVSTSWHIRVKRWYSWWHRNQDGKHFITWPVTFVISLSRLLLRKAQEVLLVGPLLLMATGTLRPMDYVWAGTNLDNVTPILVSPSTQVTFIHALDYDRVLELGQRSFFTIKDESYLVYLDRMGPLHPDFGVLGIDTLVSSDIWFEKARMALTRIQSATGMRIVIAAHPRASAENYKDLYGDFRIHYGDSTRLISEAMCVIASDPSTAFDVVACLRIPAVLIVLGEIYTTQLRELELYRTLLDLECYRWDEFPPDWGVPKINESAYTAYVETNVKRPGTREEPFWAVAIDCVTYA